MRYFIIFLYSMASLASAQEAARSCAVTLRVIDVAGRPAPYRLASFKDADGVDYSGGFEGLRGRVPCNVQLYTFQVVRTDVNNRITNIDGRVSALYPEAWMTVVTNPSLVILGDQAFQASKSLPVGYVWKGRVTPMSTERLWIRIRSAATVRSGYAEAEVEAEVDANGEFRVYGGFFEGPYVLYIMSNEGQLLYSAPLKIVKSLPTEPLLITLPAEVPPPIIIK